LSLHEIQTPPMARYFAILVGNTRMSIGGIHCGRVLTVDRRLHMILLQTQIFDEIRGLTRTQNFTIHTALTAKCHT